MHAYTYNTIVVVVGKEPILCFSNESLNASDIDTVFAFTECVAAAAHAKVVITAALNGFEAGQNAQRTGRVAEVCATSEIDSWLHCAKT